MEVLEWNTDMLVSAIVLAVTFIAIFTEELHHVHRVKCAMAGAATMIVVGQVMGFYNPDDAVHAIDWNVVFLLGGMMTIVAIMIPTGGFQQMAYWAADFSKGRLYLLLALIGSLVTGLSLLLDNVTTVKMTIDGFDTDRQQAGQGIAIKQDLFCTQVDGEDHDEQDDARCGGVGRPGVGR